MIPYLVIFNWLARRPVEQKWLIAASPYQFNRKTNALFQTFWRILSRQSATVIIVKHTEILTDLAVVPNGGSLLPN